MKRVHSLDEQACSRKKTFELPSFKARLFIQFIQTA